MASGRKKAFSESQALEAAMHVFWSKGYVGASLSALTDSMGINKPSMYSTFGNKEALFIKSTSHYVESQMKPHRQHLYQANVPLLTRIKNYMLSIVSMQFNEESPKGCYLVLCQSELAGGEVPEAASELLQELDDLPKVVIADLLNSDSEAKQLGLDTRSNEIALTLYTVLKGSASMARSGITQEQMLPVVDNVIAGLATRH